MSRQVVHFCLKFENVLLFVFTVEISCYVQISNILLDKAHMIQYVFQDTNTLNMTIYANTT